MPVLDNLMRMVNPFPMMVLRSRLHGWMSSVTVLLRFKGRKSGKVIHDPVNYILQDRELWIISQRYRFWWRNLTGSSPIYVLFKGEWFVRVSLPLRQATC